MADFLKNRLERIQSAGKFRSLAGTVHGVDFWSNDYLGLAQLQAPITPTNQRTNDPTDQRPNDPTTQQTNDPTDQRPNDPTTQPSGATGSRSISGDSDVYHALEQRIADFHGHPAALVFNSGYTANLGLLSAILKRGDTIIYDDLIHASCRDGIRLGFARAVKFPHNDLEQTLIRKGVNERMSGQLFVLTEGRFSMGGDVAPLRKIATLCQKYGAHLIVDEAHSGGVDGDGGRGLVAELGLQSEVFATVITYGKAFGAHGAAVLGSQELRDYLINSCRPFIYTTGPAPAQWHGVAEAYDRMEALHKERFAQLELVITWFRSGMAEAGIGGFLTPNEGPVQIVHLPGNDAVMAAEALCREAGLLVKGIRSPTVAEGSERIRVCLHSFNTEMEVVGLVEALQRVPLPA